MKIFISHARNDNRLARVLIEELDKLGHTIKSPETISSGEEIKSTLETALNECEAMIVLLNPHSYQSPWVKFEVEYALSSDNYKDHLLPVLIGKGFDAAPQKTPWILTTINHLILPNSDEMEANANKIIEAFKKIEAKKEG